MFFFPRIVNKLIAIAAKNAKRIGFVSSPDDTPLQTIAPIIHKMRAVTFLKVKGSFRYHEAKITVITELEEKTIAIIGIDLDLKTASCNKPMLKHTQKTPWKARETQFLLLNFISFLLIRYTADGNSIKLPIKKRSKVSVIGCRCPASSLLKGSIAEKTSEVKII